MDEECTLYLLDTNIIVSAVLKGEKIRKCLEKCDAKYVIHKVVIDELIRLISEERKFRKIAFKIRKKLKSGKITISEFIRKEFSLIAVLLKANIQLITEKPDEESIVRAEKIVGHRDPSDIPIVAIALYLAKNRRNEKVCIWTDNRDVLEELPKKEKAVKAVRTPHCCN